jgi:peptidoglycan/xylan/chitin deacetylase (PgdA/CDA1 family)
VHRVTLTFDNGPTPGLTDRVLEALDRAGILTTFFVIGRNLADPSARSLMRDAHAAGHWIGNHTLTHTVALGDCPDAGYAETEIGETQLLIGELSHPHKLFRPYGNQGLIGPHLLSRAAVSYLLEHQYCSVLWNCVPGDWRDPIGWLDVCIAQAKAQDWAVVVLHDIPDACVARLPELMARLNDIGVQWEQEYPESVILTRGGEVRSLPPSYVADGLPTSAAPSGGVPGRP